MKRWKLLPAGMKKIMARLTAKDGSVMNLALLVLVLLNIIAFGVSRLASTNVKIATNDKSDKTALFQAESGADEVIARLATISNTTNDPAAQKYDPAWRLFIGTAANAASKFGYASGNTKHHLLASGVTDLDYTVMVRKKLESDLPHDAADVSASCDLLPYGDDRNGDTDCNDVLVWQSSTGTLSSDDDTTPPVAETGNFIYVVTSTATVNNMERQMITEILSKSDIEISNGMYVNGDLTNSGAAPTVIGNYNPACADVVPIATTINASTGKEASDYTGTTGGLAPEDGVDVIDIASIAADLCAAPTATISVTKETNPTYGGVSPNNTGVYCTTGNYDANNIQGYGVLVVNGNFAMSGKSWNGLIIVTGTAQLSGSGTLTGAIMANGMASKGGPDINFDCEVLHGLLENTPKTTKIYRWQDF